MTEKVEIDCSSMAVDYLGPDPQSLCLTIEIKLDGPHPFFLELMSGLNDKTGFDRQTMVDLLLATEVRVCDWCGHRQ